MSIPSILLELTSIEVLNQESLEILESCIRRIADLNEKRDERLRKLDALEAWGVDNWEGFDEAMRELHAEDEDE